MENRRKVYIYFLIPLLLLVGVVIVRYAPGSESENNPSRGFFIRDGQDYPIEVVSSGEAMARGLGGRDMIGSMGMLFIFPEDGYHGFWMKDMRFDIDIIWLDSSYRVVHVEERVSADSFPTTYRPKTEARYVFETKSGFIDENKIEVGEILNFSI